MPLGGPRPQSVHRRVLQQQQRAQRGRGRAATVVAAAAEAAAAAAGARPGCLIRSLLLSSSGHQLHHVFLPLPCLQCAPSVRMQVELAEQVGREGEQAGTQFGRSAIKRCGTEPGAAHCEIVYPPGHKESAGRIHHKAPRCVAAVQLTRMQSAALSGVAASSAAPPPAATAPDPQVALSLRLRNRYDRLQTWQQTGCSQVACKLAPRSGPDWRELRTAGLEYARTMKIRRSTAFREGRK